MRELRARRDGNDRATHGSSGRFSGDIEGLYEGYREGYPISTRTASGHRTGNPEVQQVEVELANGTLALSIRHLTPVRRERGQNPWRDGGDPWTDPPPGRPTSCPSTRCLLNAAAPRWRPCRRRSFRVAALQVADPQVADPPARAARGRCLSSICAACSVGHRPRAFDRDLPGASGEMFVEADNHREFGYLEVETPNGVLHMTFTEHPEEGKLAADLEVDGSRSTGRYANAKGQLKFALDIYRGIGLGKGPYWGTLWLASPSDTAKAARAAGQPALRTD